VTIEGVNRYLTGAFRDVDGWCVPHLWQSIHPLYEQIAGAGIEAPIAEIGVFHGKFLIGLAAMMGAAKKNYAIDVYDMQQFNLDGAGHGRVEKVKENILKSGLSLDQFELLRADSMAITDGEIDIIRAETGGFAFFSVDGCHMVEHTINDISIAMRLTRPEGVIFVDDYYNPHWPGAQEGVAKMYLMSSPRFVPLIYSCNKLMLCHISFHERYFSAARKFIGENFPKTNVKPVKRFGYDTLSVFPDLQSEEYVKL
jgi:hypothetical protein